MSCFLLPDRDFERVSCLTLHKFEAVLNDPNSPIGNAKVTKVRSVKKSIWRLKRRNKKRDFNGLDKSDDIPIIDLQHLHKLANRKSDLILNRSSQSANENSFVEKLNALLHEDSSIPTIALPNRNSSYHHCCEEYPPSCLPSPCIEEAELPRKNHSIVNFLKEIETKFRIPEEDEEEEEVVDERSTVKQTTSNQIEQEIQPQQSSVFQKNLRKEINSNILHSETHADIREEEEDALNTEIGSCVISGIERKFNDIYNLSEIDGEDNEVHYFEPLKDANHNRKSLCIIQGDSIIEVQSVRSHPTNNSAWNSPERSRVFKHTGMNHYNYNNAPHFCENDEGSQFRQIGQIEKVELWMSQHSKFLRVSSSKTLESTKILKKHVRPSDHMRSNEQMYGHHADVDDNLRGNYLRGNHCKKHGRYASANPYAQNYAQFSREKLRDPRFCYSEHVNNEVRFKGSPIWERRRMVSPPSPLQLPLKIRKRMNSI